MNLAKYIYLIKSEGEENEMDENNLEQQGVEMAQSASAEVCANCGALLGDDQTFCPKCGTPRSAAPKKPVCGSCGAELEEGQKFCPKCGQKAGLAADNNAASAISQFNSDADKQNSKKKKTPIVIAAAIVIVVLAVIAFKTVIPNIFIDAEGCMEKGNYEKAYEKAKTDDEKLEVIAENIAAVQSAVSADSLKDPSSFSLREAYYYKGENDDGEPTNRLVLYISGANSYGASVSSYWLYTWSNEKNKWEYFCSVSDLSEDEFSDYDDEDEKLEKLVDNIGRLTIKIVMEDGIELSKNSIKRINAMFEADTLDDVELLDVEAPEMDSDKEE